MKVLTTISIIISVIGAIGIDSEGTHIFTLMAGGGIISAICLLKFYWHIDKEEP